MKIYLNKTVEQAALERINRLFDEFENIIVNFSGGKDSTVVLNLTLKVAEERGRLPVGVLFLDQEAEWQNVIDYIRVVMSDPRVKPYWFQGPFRIFNATSGDQPWLGAWEEGATWLRDKEPSSIHENIMGTDRFAELFGAFGRTYFKGQPLAQIAGVRAEESPARALGLTGQATDKDITWGKYRDRKTHQYDFYPLYDWSYTDIWKAIHDNGWPYCKLYDYMYNYGIQVQNMRVSNVHHETAVDSLRFLQEIEPETWNRITERVLGVNAVSKVREAYSPPSELPWMFETWEEYRDHLLENLIDNEDHKAIWRRQFASNARVYLPEIMPKVIKMQIASILVNDYFGTKQTTFSAGHHQQTYNSGIRGHAINR